MGNYEASNEILKFIGKTVDITVKNRKIDLENVYIDEVLKNKMTYKPSIIYFTTQGGRGECGMLNFESIVCMIERPLVMEEVIKVPELKGVPE